MSNGLRKTNFRLRKAHILRSALPLLTGILLLHPASVNAKDIHSGPKVNPASSATQTKPAEAPRFLDQKKIHATYSEGDFESVIAAIDSFTHATKTYSQDDSVFIAKHLAVIYTANPATREKGKNYMFRLLNLLPSAKIVDMFVSDEIDHIFEKVREEYVVRQQMTGQETPSHQESNKYATDKMTMQGKESPKPAEPFGREPTGKSSHPYYWIAGGITVFAVTGAAFYLLKPAKASDKTYDVP